MKASTTALAALLIALLGTMAFSANADAASYKQLKAKGYKTGKLTRNTAGISGWVVSKGGDRQFCRRTVVTFLVGSGLRIISPAGKQIKLDKKAYFDFVKKRGGTVDVPRWSDIKAGRIKPGHAGRCTRYR